ncbi:hypothetical protein ACN28C_28155 [Plantactinospora sp. WMMC1484]|uniref:hypothetical protein n=1 Tax=Plantactinospora sp. WMMC1484 TaxID=3404122 RepID=UPI003BF5F75E
MSRVDVATVVGLLERLRGAAPGAAGQHVDSSPRPPGPASPGAAEPVARAILAALGYQVSDGPIHSPQGRSCGMFSRRLAHVRIDLAARDPADDPAAVICHEAAHCVDEGPYDFDHPWPKTAEQRDQAVRAQLVACLSSHLFVRGELDVEPGPGQLALAGHMVRTLVNGSGLAPSDAHGIAGRVEAVTRTLRAALSAPPWVDRPTREVAVDRGRGVMWLSIGPAASTAPPPSAPAALAATLSRRAQRRFADDPRFTTELDRSRPVATTTD